MSAGLGSHAEALGKKLLAGPFSIVRVQSLGLPGQVPVPLRAVGHSLVLTQSPHIVKGSSSTLRLPHPWKLFGLPFCYQLDKTLGFERDHGIVLGSTDNHIL